MENVLHTEDLVMLSSQSMTRSHPTSETIFGHIAKLELEGQRLRTEGD